MSFDRFFRLASIPALLLCALFTFTGAAAQAASISLLRDPDVEHGLNRLAAPVLRAAGLNANRVRILLVNDSSFNAFVVDSRTIFVHYGLILKVTSPEMLQAVIAHEAAHITNGHLARRMQNLRSANSAAGLGLALAALAAAGQPSDRFVFEGFIPSKGAPRQQAIERLATSDITSIIYEAPHRVLSFLEALRDVVSSEREITLCRELTKQFETIRRGSVAELCDWVAGDSNQQRGELVLILSPAEQAAGWNDRDQALAKLLLAELPASRAAKILAAHTGMKRQEVYALLEAMSG